VLYTPVNNVPLNAQITGINVFNDRVRYEWSQIAGPTAIPMPPAAYTANINDIPVSSSTFNVPPLNLNALAYGIYTLRLTVEDEYYAGSTITQDITFEVKPPQSNLDVTVNPASETTVEPYNNFTFSGEVTGINANSDVIITYWRAENGNPASIALPHTMASPNAIPLGTTTFNQSVTMNQRITEGTYEFWFVAKDIFYNVGDSAKVKIIVKPGESTFALTIEPTPEKRVIKTPEGFIFNEGENPQNTPFSVKGRVTGISDKTDYVRTYWRMQYEPELPDQEEQLQPTLPHTASAMKNIDLGVTSDESEIVFNLGNCSAGTYTLHFVARDVFYNTADSVSTKIIVTKPVSIEPSVTFTPNGDGQNDIWFVKNIESFPFVGVKIINERGELIFETDSFSRLPERGWDGRRKDGKLATEGAYYYQFYDTRDQKIFNVGSFVLLR
jgi:gliding motility-associated-like protein